MFDLIGNEYKIGCLLAYANGGSLSGSMRIYRVVKMNPDKGTIRAIRYHQRWNKAINGYDGDFYQAGITTLNDTRRGVILPDSWLKTSEEEI